MKLETIIPPASLPVDIESIKIFMRILDSEHDAEIELMIKTAIKRAEDLTNRQLGGIATFALHKNKFVSNGMMCLPKTPIISVEGIEYRDENEEWQTLSTELYDVDERETPAKIFFGSTPKTSEKPNSVKITFQAGYETLPVEVESWLKVTVSTMFEHRETVVVGSRIDTFENGYIDNLLDSLRILPI